MALAVGDRHIVSTGPAQIQGDDPWPCARCGSYFPRCETWAVNYRHDDGDEYSFMVCPACGEELEPVSVVIDVAALESLGGRSRDVQLESLVATVERLRGAGRRDEIAIRWMDLDVLAATRGMSVREFVVELQRRGVAKTSTEAKDS